MKKRQKTELKLSKTQVQNVINDHLQRENGLNDLFAMMVMASISLLKVS